MRSIPSPLLARSLHGEAHYCACKDRVSMRFKERWFHFGPGGLAEFRGELERLLRDPVLTKRLVEEAVSQAVDRGSAPDTLPTFEDLGEMLNLIDTSLLILDAQDVVKKS